MRVLRALSSLLVTVTLIGCTSQSTAPGPTVLRDLKEICEKRGFAEGNTTTPGDYVIERAFVES